HILTALGGGREYDDKIIGQAERVEHDIDASIRGRVEKPGGAGRDEMSRRTAIALDGLSERGLAGDQFAETAFARIGQSGGEFAAAAAGIDHDGLAPC